MAGAKETVTEQTRDAMVVTRVRHCVPDDYGALAELYFKVLPMAGPLDLQSDLAEDGSSLTLAVENAEGEIEMALLASGHGAIFLTDPNGELSPERRSQFLALTEEVWRGKVPALACGLPIAIPSSLRRFGELLEQAGFVSREVFQIRVVHFTGPDMQRAS